MHEPSTIVNCLVIYRYNAVIAIIISKLNLSFQLPHNNLENNVDINIILFRVL